MQVNKSLNVRNSFTGNWQCLYSFFLSFFFPSFFTYFLLSFLPSFLSFFLSVLINLKIPLGKSATLGFLSFDPTNESRGYEQDQNTTVTNLSI
jgi:hypothetical protein